MPLTHQMLEPSSVEVAAKELTNRHRFTRDRFFSTACLLASALALVILISLLTAVLVKGLPSLNLRFLENVHVENRPEASGISQALVGSLLLCLICGALALPIGIGTAIYLEEFQPLRRWMRGFQKLVQLNITNLAGIPSIVYGILGVSAFVYMFGLFRPIQVNQVPAFEVGAAYYYQAKTISNRRAGIEGQMFSFPVGSSEQTLFAIEQPRIVMGENGQTFELNVIDADAPLPEEVGLLLRTVRRGTSASRFSERSSFYFHLPFGKSVLAAGFTLALVVLPIVIIASQEAIRAVPQSLREAAFGLGATRWQAVYGVVLPQALPGILTGAILALSRAIGEAAPVIAVMGGILGTTRGLSNLMDGTPVLPVTIYKWSGHQNHEYENLAAAAIIVLLMILLTINALAIAIRYRLAQKRIRVE
jgi:phosphate transport system permease protein